MHSFKINFLLFLISFAVTDALAQSRKDFLSWNSPERVSVNLCEDGAMTNLVNALNDELILVKRGGLSILQNPCPNGDYPLKFAIRNMRPVEDIEALIRAGATFPNYDDLLVTLEERLATYRDNVADLLESAERKGLVSTDASRSIMSGMIVCDQVGVDKRGNYVCQD